MEKKDPIDLEYKGDSPTQGAVKGYAVGFAISLPIIVAIDLAIAKFSNKVPFRENTWQRIKDGLPSSLSLDAIVSLWDGYLGYSKSKKAQISHNQLLTDNIAMRSQLNQTGQILQHVASQVEQGALKDSTLTLTDAAPETAAAQENAAGAVEALAKAETKSHATTIAERRAEAAEAAPTVH